MYEKRFGLHRKPFQSVLSDHDFYESETFGEILPGMLHALRSDLGVAVLTGPAGVGKSVTLEAVRRKLEGNCQAILVRGGTVKSAGDLLFLLHRSLLKCQGAGATEGTESSDTVRRWEVMERLQRVAEFWGPLVVLLDDAHLVEADVFAELRALLEEELDGQKLVRLLITGPLVLEEVLAEPGHSDFAQKIRTHVFLQPLNSVESVQFLSHNISNAGGELSAVMENSAIERIVAAADGVPRCLNLLADESLIVCEESKQDRATRESVDKALKRLQHLPYAWNVSLYDDSEDGDDFGMEQAEPDVGSVSAGADSVVEFGSSVDAVVASSPGVIEIGGAPIAPQVPVPEPAVHGVIEIGAPVEALSQPAAIDVAAASVVTERAGVDLVSNDECVVESEQFDVEIAEEFLGVETDAETFFLETDENADSENEDAFEEECEVDEIESDGESYENEGKLAALLANVSFGDEMVSMALEDVSLEGGDDTDSTLEEVSLEHHLLLAGSDSQLDCCDTTSSCDAVAASDDVEADLKVAATTDEPVVDSDVALDGFSRWEPAGEWPAEGPVVEASLAEVSVLESIAIEPVRPNAKPVFDRYTWCELGRSVTPLQRNRMDLTALAGPAVWPPVTDGIAPVDAIPMETIHEDYAELLTDLGVIVDAASEGAAPVSDSTNEAHSGGVSLLATPTEFSPVVNGWDAAIDEIQNLIDVEQSAELEAATHDSAEAEACEADDGAGWSGGQLFVGERTSGCQSPLSVHPIDEESPLGDGVDFDPDSGAAESSLPVIVDLESVRTESEIPSEDTESDGQLLCEERSVGDFVAEDEEQQRYVPRLMQEVRQRGLGQSASGGRLRYAAGAESFEGVSAESDDGVGEIRLARADDADVTEEVDTAESVAEGGRFLNLFTKLRKLRKTSA